MSTLKLIPQFRQRRPTAQRHPQLLRLVQEMDRNWTQLELAAKAGVSQTTLTQLRQGKTTTQFDLIDAVATAMGYEVIIRKKLP